ncbi:MAG: hypothetical protein IJR88_06545 [Clostridia bacterium]|nr:hypothetical protein [Clostridia bacterium]
MAQFTNQAALSYNGVRVLSNVTVGTLTEVLSVSKTVVEETYTTGGTLTYVVSLINSGSVALNDLTITDDLGGYPFGEGTLYPLTYVEGSVKQYLEGVLVASPVVAETTPLTFTGVGIPAGSEVILIYQATVTEYAPLGEGATIVNTVTASGDGVEATASATVNAENGPILDIVKSVSPIPVVDNGLLTYTFLIQNFGAEEATDAAKVVVSDTFNPVLTGLTAALDGVTLSPTTDYTYDEATGEFETVAGVITVPAATYSQDPDTGAYTVTPGSVTLTVSGTI